MSGVQDKVALVTGAAGGLGRATAMQLAQQGARLALTDNNATNLNRTVELIQQAGGQVVALAGDVAVSGTSAQLVSLALQTYGAVDVVCNVAGVLSGGTIEEATVAEFDRTMHINCMAQLLLIQQALPALRRSRRASIVNVASVGALAALPMMSIYCASKAAVLGLTRAVATELAPDIRCNAICPGGIDTPMAQTFLAQFTPAEREAILPKLTGRQLLKRFAQPEEIASLIVYLASDESSFITGAVLPIEGGHTSW